MSKKTPWLVLFVETDPPQTHGGAIVRASGGVAACEKVGRLGIAPEGKAMYPAGELAIKVPAKLTDRRLTDGELDALRGPQ